MKSSLLALLCAFALVLSTPVHATVFSLRATLTGSQEAPPNLSLGTGSGIFTLDDATNVLTWNVVFSGLAVGATAAHFHGSLFPSATPCAGLVCPVLVPAPLGSALGQTAGVITGSVDLDTLAAVSANIAFHESNLLNGFWYFNIHNTQFPGGEIRGQVRIPEPAALALLALGLAALAARRQRDKYYISRFIEGEGRG